MQGVIAHKVGMSRVFQDDGSAVPVTYLKVEPNTVVRLKTEEKDGYNAVVLGVGAKQWKSRKGKENTNYAKQKEWKVESAEGLKAGDSLTVELLPKDTTVTITGVSKGRGFQGVIKRHGFSRGPETHGSHHHRRPGSVGMCEFPGRILKGKKMPGRMGNDQVTLRDRSILVCDAEEGVVAVKGPVPGPNGAAVFVTVESWPEDFDVMSLFGGAGSDADASQDDAPAEEAPKEEAKAEEPKKEEEAPKEEAKAEEPQEKEEEKKEDTPESA